MVKDWYCRGNPKLSEEQKKAMVEMYLNTDKILEQVAEEFGCSKSLVHKYVKEEKQKEIF